MMEWTINRITLAPSSPWILFHNNNNNVMNRKVRNLRLFMKNSQLGSSWWVRNICAGKQIATCNIFHTTT